MLPRDEVVCGIQQELASFADLVRSLDERDFFQQSRCQGWTVGDVARHVVGVPADITTGRIEGQGTAEVTKRQVGERRGRTASELADELDLVAKPFGDLLAALDDAAWMSEPPGNYATTLGQAMEGLWLDAFVHADDIRDAVKRPSERGPGLRASVHYLADLLTEKGWGPATLVLEGLDEVSVSGLGRPIAGSTVPRITGDPLAFVLAATGRVDPSQLGLDPRVRVYG